MGGLGDQQGQGEDVLEIKHGRVALLSSQVSGRAPALGAILNQPQEQSPLPTNS